MKLYRKNNIYREYREFQDTHERTGSQRKVRKTVRKQKRGKEKKKWEKQDISSYFLCEKEKLWFCAVTGCPAVMQERAWQCLKGMSEWKTA